MGVNGLRNRRGSCGLELHDVMTEPKVQRLKGETVNRYRLPSPQKSYKWITLR